MTVENRAEIVASTNFDHILCTHNLVTAPKIAELLNQIGLYDHIGFEMCADPATQAHHRGIMQGLVDREIDPTPVVTNVTERDAFQLTAALLNQRGAIIHTPDWRDPSFSRISNGANPAADMIWSRGQQNAVREVKMVEGVLDKILEIGKSGQRAALITGAIHTYPSAIFKMLGMNVTRHFLIDESMSHAVEGQRLLGEQERIRYNDLLALQRAVAYGKVTYADVVNYFKDN